jgi:diguanylate cyclase (GGDEF)-like protein
VTAIDDFQETIRVDAARYRASLPPLGGAAPRKTLRVLSVDDDPRFTERVRRLLEAEDFAVTIESVHSVAELEEALGRRTWNVVVSDHSMLGFFSEDARNLVRSRELSLPFIVVSGYTANDASAVSHLGSGESVSKTSLSGLAAAVRIALQDAAERERLRQRARNLGALEAVALATAVDGVDQLAAAQHAAHYDALTGLPNRLLLIERLTKLIAECEQGNKTFALLYADLDDFRQVNDAFGHEAGNAVLRELGRRLGRVSATIDGVTRFAADQFGIVFPMGTGRREAVAASERIIGFLKQPFPVGPQDVHLDLSMGIAIFPDHGRDAEALLEHAEHAMFAAKRSQTRYRTYGAELDTHSQERVALAADLRHALIADELVLYYQPQVDIATGAVVGAEALLRWQDPHRGLVPPMHFIPLAEQTGLITEITPWVVRAALRQVLAWRAAGLDMRVSVNVAMRNLHDPQFLQTIEALVESSGVPAKALTLEITEGTIMLEAERVLDVLHRFQKMGIGIAIDNFGTGFSSLSTLSQLPVDEIKIDKSFVMALPEPGSRAIVESVIGLGRAFDLRVVAEGLKNEATFDAIAALHCPVAQGFHFSAPIPADAFAEWTQAWARP